MKLALTTEYTAKDCVPQATGCDGVLGSKKVLDTCGVCGGNGTTCDACAAATIQHRHNGAYVNFNLGSGVHKDEVVFPDGTYYGYSFPGPCQRVTWNNIRVQCLDGTWTIEPNGSLDGDNNCFVDKNASWSSDDNSITTGGS